MRLDALALADVRLDPLASLLFCPVPRVDLNLMQGRLWVRKARLTTPPP